MYLRGMLMIVAYCDGCGQEIPPTFPAGVRYVLGRKEFSGHLCPECMKLVQNDLDEHHGIHPLRTLKSGSTT